VLTAQKTVMTIVPNETYHIYNQGNNGEKLFYGDEDYIIFLKLCRKYISPNCDILAYCLMPNHFHFLIHTNENSARTRQVGHLNLCELSNGFRLLQSTYAQYINNRENRTGSLFRQKIKAKSLDSGDENYGWIAFNYIHLNPLKARLVEDLDYWKFSSFLDYAGVRSGTLCNKELAYELLTVDTKNFIKDTYSEFSEEKIKKIF
jgi:REP element-mobilizing transposase RayT